MSRQLLSMVPYNPAARDGANCRLYVNNFILFFKNFMTMKSGYALITMLVLLLVPAVAVAQTGSVKGKVKEEGGKALEGVLVRAINAKDKGGEEDKHLIRSDSKGEFEFSSLPAGDYSFSLEKPGYKTFLTRRLAVVGGETLRVAAELKREAEPFSLVRGAVLYGAGYSLPNASVLIERIDGGKKFKQEKVSGEGGQFVFRLRAEKAKYRITANARGFLPSSTEIEIESDEVRNVALTLQQVK